MEEQRQRQEEEARRAAAASAAEAGIATTGAEGVGWGRRIHGGPGQRCGRSGEAWQPWDIRAGGRFRVGLCGPRHQLCSAPLCLFPDSDDALLKMTIGQQEFGRTGLPDLSSMTEEEQIAYAMQMSLQGAGEPEPGTGRFDQDGLPKWSSADCSLPQSSARQSPLTSMPVQPWTHRSPPR